MPEHNVFTDNFMNKTLTSYIYPPMQEMKQHLSDINLGYDPVKHKKFDWFRNGKKFEEDVKKYWLACELNKNLGDVSLIEELPKADLWFTSFPCQDVSCAGKMRGLNPEDDTRSSLVWQTVRLLDKAKQTNTLPKYIMLENVKALVGEKFKPDFDKFNSLIEEFGYNTYWQVLNGKECGIPQNRERVFAVYIREDIDRGSFTFPKPFDNGLRLIDIVEDDVDKGYYIDKEKSDVLIEQAIADGRLVRDGDTLYAPD